MEVMIDPEKSSLLRAAPRVMQILRVLARHKFLRALLGKRHWPPPKVVRETLEELGLTFLKFGQVLAMRHWHDTLGDIMLFSGIAGMLITGIGALRRGHSQR